MRTGVFFSFTGGKEIECADAEVGEMGICLAKMEDEF